ncbi:MAG: hypothetical protein QGF68_06515 [Nitrospinota bacterium]|nr:hypothetical protein [Nitrospinota bacterium]MDP7384790.1 hypothetical protein [Nitrospinota bacterium]
MTRTFFRVAGPIMLSAALFGCRSPIPDHFQRDFLVEPNAGYLITDERANGFDLEVFYYEQVVLPKRKNVVENAKSTFVQIAAWLASRIGRTPREISKRDLRVTVNRKTLERRYEVSVTGRVTYR